MTAGRKVALLCVDPWERHTSFAPFNYAVRRVQASLLAAGIEGAEVHLVETRSREPDDLLERLEAIEPDVVGASAYVWSFATFVEVARQLKRRRPDVTVIFGGPSARPAMFELEPYRQQRFACDALVLGEGERVFPRIVELAVRDHAALSTIPGLALPTREGFRSTGSPELIADLDALPSPYGSGLVPAGVSAHVETFRGCPLSCSFCQWGDSGGNSRIFSREYLARELAAMKQLKLTDALIVDAGLNLNPRAFRNLAWAEREVGFLREAGLNFEIYPSHLSDEHVEFLSRVRVQTIGIGLQSYDQEVLRRVQRPFDGQRFERVVRQLCELPNADLRIEIILGLPHDGPESFMRTLRRARELPCGVRVFHCLVLPDALMTRAPPGADMVFDPVTLHMRSCAGWSEKALRETAERLTVLCQEAGGQVEGGFYWSFPGVNSRTDGARSMPASGPAMQPAASRVEELPAPLVARVSSLVNAATAGQWSVASVTRENCVVVLETSTPAGLRHIELTAAAPGASAYRVVGDVAVRYRPTAEPAPRDFLAALDRLTNRAGPLFASLLDTTPPAAPSASPPPNASTALDLAAHEFALQASGFTILRSLVARDQIAELADVADRALAETRRQLELGAAIPDGVFDLRFQLGTRGLYLWGDACLRVLENGTIRQLAQVVIGPHKLIDVVLFVSHPAADVSQEVSEGWHRDVEPVLEDPYRARYLWFMLPIDDFVATNGATCVVPGSHRVADPAPSMGSTEHLYPSRMQMLLAAGDVLVLDPAALHSRGHNGTDRPRRMLNIMVCHEAAPLRWQWDFAGQRVRATASPRVRELLGGSLSTEARAAFAAKAAPLNHLQRNHAIRTPAWPALPPGWQE